MNFGKKSLINVYSNFIGDSAILVCKIVQRPSHINVSWMKDGATISLGNLTLDRRFLVIVEEHEQVEQISLNVRLTRKKYALNSIIDILYLNRFKI